MFPKFNTFSVSNILIYISVIFTAISFFYQSIFRFGMNDLFLQQWIYHIFIIQMFTSMFLHGGITHILFNSVFVYLFGNQVEIAIWKKNYLYFFIFTAIFTGVWLTLVNAGNTIWISSFCLAILTYYTLHLWQKGNIEYKGWITAIIVNLAIWFYPGISLSGHLLWAIAGLIFFLLISNFRGKVIQPL